MKNELLLSTLLLASPVAQTFAKEAPALLREASLSTNHLLGEVFRSQVQYIELSDYYWEDSFTGFVEVAFVKSEEFNWYAEEGEMPPTIKVNIRTFDVKRGEDLYLASTFHYAKRIGNRLYRLYDCDSTASCHSDWGYTDFYIFDTPQGKLIKVKKSTSLVNNFFVNSLLETK